MAVDVSGNPISVTVDFTVLSSLENKDITGARWVGAANASQCILSSSKQPYYTQTATGDNFVDEIWIPIHFREAPSVLVTGGILYIYLKESKNG